MLEPRTHARAAIAGAGRNQLGEDVYFHALQVARNVGIVKTRVAALNGNTGQPRAGLQEELVDLDVRWQSVSAQGSDVEQLGIGRKQSVQQWLHEPPLKIRAVAGPRQCEPSEDGEAQMRVGLDETVECVEEQHGLAYADRCRDLEIWPDAIDDRLRALDRIGRMKGVQRRHACRRSSRICDGSVPLPSLAALGVFTRRVIRD